MAEHRIAPPDFGGKYDDVIDWLKRLENKLMVWGDKEKPPCYGLIDLLSDHDRHRHSVTYRPFGRTYTNKDAEKLWKPVEDAVNSLKFEMERGRSLTSNRWADYLKRVQEVRRKLQADNPPAENPIKY